MCYTSVLVRERGGKREERKKGEREEGREEREGRERGQKGRLDEGEGEGTMQVHHLDDFRIGEGVKEEVNVVSQF